MMFYPLDVAASVYGARAQESKCKQGVQMDSVLWAWLKVRA